MASNPRSQSVMGSRIAAASASNAAKRTYFEQQRELLMGEIAMSFEHVLANINKLNRSLEAVITVGNEFSSVEALWSQFESVMAKEEEPAEGAGAGNGNGDGDGDGNDAEEDQSGEQDETAEEEDWEEQTPHARTRSDAER